MSLSHNSLENYYLTTFAMIQHHKWSLTEIEDMMPYERDIYVTMLTNWIKEENERIQKQKHQVKMAEPNAQPALREVIDSLKAQKQAIEKNIELIKSRNKILENIVPVDKELLIKEKETLTGIAGAMKGVTDLSLIHI